MSGPAGSPGSTPRDKLLVVRIGRGGDLVMVTPALRVLLDRFPDAEVHLLTRDDGPRILGDFDARVTRVRRYDRRFVARLRGERSLRAALEAEGYTRAFVFETKPFYRAWLSAVAPAVHGLWSLPSTGDPKAGRVNRHFSDLCLDLLDRALGAPVARPWVSLPVSAAGVAAAHALLAAHDVRPDARLVGLHATFSGIGRAAWRKREGMAHRVWPLAHCARLATLLRERAAREGMPLAIVCDVLPEERDYVAPFVAASGGAVTLLAAPPDFQRYKGLLSLLDVLVSPNTGPMHFGAALGTPLVALFSKYSAADCGPYADPARYRVLAAAETAHPERGLAAVVPEAVAAAVWDMLRTAAARD
jgi:ADP-heptose:LPS heptosyltransferase